MGIMVQYNVKDSLGNIFDIEVDEALSNVKEHLERILTASLASHGGGKLTEYAIKVDEGPTYDEIKAGLIREISAAYQRTVAIGPIIVIDDIEYRYPINLISTLCLSLPIDLDKNKFGSDLPWYYITVHNVDTKKSELLSVQSYTLRSIQVEISALLQTAQEYLSDILCEIEDAATKEALAAIRWEM